MLLLFLLLAREKRVASTSDWRLVKGSVRRREAWLWEIRAAIKVVKADLRLLRIKVSLVILKIRGCSIALLGI